jgi:hypothetical protein
VPPMRLVFLLIAAFCRLAKSLSHSELMGWLVGAVGIEPTSEAWEVLNIAIPFSSQRQVARLKCKSIVVQ